MDISSYLKAGYPALYVTTPEVDRATRSIIAAGWQVLSWDCLRGVTSPGTGQVIDDVIDPVQALKWLGGHGDTVLLVQTFHHFIGSVEVIQEILNSLPTWKAQGSCLVMVGPPVTLPPEIESYFTLLDFDLPSLADLGVIQKELGESLGVAPDPEAIEAALGLTEFEAETAFALSLVLKKKFCPIVITEQKKQMIKRTGLLEFWPPVPMTQVGGLDLLKKYLVNRRVAFTTGHDHLPKPKAILLVGIPGTGKSLASKAAASILNWPLIRLDIASLKGSLVGESERRIRRATQIIDGFGQAVVWLDEVEKAFSGVKSSGQTDGGTLAAMLGHFLTWLQETTSPILVMATANNLSDLPPEFLRAGRFDALFFVDLPNLEERAAIMAIMNDRYQAAIPPAYAAKLQGWTGAEIEQLAKDSLFDGLAEAFDQIVPLSRTMKEEINSLREWARTRARRANAPEDLDPRKVRRIDR